MIKISALFACLLAAWLVACAPQKAGKTDSTPSEVGKTKKGPIKERFHLRPKAKAGQRVRTTRTLSSLDDSNPKATVKFEINEAYVQRVISAERGIPTKVERFYEFSTQSIGAPGSLKTEDSPLAGETIELAQRVGGLSVRVIDGMVSEAILQKLLIVGFDVALLPTKPVGLGDVWSIDVVNNPGLGALMKSFGLEGKSNVMKAQLAAMDDDLATISLDWKVTGSVGGDNALVFRMRGEMRYQLSTGLIREVSFNGGKRTSGGATRNQIAMTITRENAKAWYE